MKKIAFPLILCCLALCGCSDDTNDKIANTTPEQQAGQCDPQCEAPKVCVDGACVLACDDGLTKCGDVCLNLADLHLKSCSSCTDGYCDKDNDLTNGCEINATADDTSNCGACGKACEEDQTCESGVCTNICGKDEIQCNGTCTNLEALHLSSCEACADNYCDGDENLANGCEINAKADDINNCGACGTTCKEGQSCKDGVCTDLCKENESWCNGNCLNFNELHLSACDACAESYCDADSNLANGCEIDALADDINNCGACGHVCEEGDKCDQGQCIHRYYVMLNPTPVTDDKGTKLGTLERFTIVNVAEKGDTKYRIVDEQFTGQSAWITAEDLMDAGDQYPNRKAIDLAEIYLYNKEDKLCTLDFRTHEPILENLDALTNYNNHCANFVSAILQNVGLLSKHQNGAQSLTGYLVENDGYHKLDNIADAKAGDVWRLDGHVELVVGYHKKAKKLLLIGSNNTDKYTYGCNGGNSMGNKNACSGSGDCSSNQRVTYSFIHDDGNVYSKQ